MGRIVCALAGPTIESTSAATFHAESSRNQFFARWWLKKATLLSKASLSDGII
jgi:hypothetical protein